MSEAIKEHIKGIENLDSFRVGMLQDLRDFWREQMALQKDFGQRQQQLAKRYLQKLSTRFASPTVPPVVRSTLDQSKYYKAYLSVYSQWESIGKEWVGLGEKLNRKISEPLKDLITQYDTDKAKIKEYYDAMLEDFEKYSKDIQRKQSEYHSLYENHQKLKMTDKKWKSSYEELQEKKVHYKMAVSTFNAYQVQLFEILLPSMENMLIDLDSGRMDYLKEAMMRTHECNMSALEKMRFALAESKEKTHKFQSAQDMEFFCHKRNEDHPMKLSWKECLNSQSDNDTFDFSGAKMEAQFVSFLVKEYVKKYDKWNALEKKLRATDADKNSKQITGSHTAASPSTSSISKSDGPSSPLTTETKSISDSIKQIKSSAKDATTASKEFQIFYNKMKLELDQVQYTAQMDVLSEILHHEFKDSLLEHTFKIRGRSMKSSICDQCEESIWPLQGMSLICEECGYVCHQKCKDNVLPFCGLVQVGQVKAKPKTADGDIVRPKPVGLTVPFSPISLSPLHKNRNLDVIQILEHFPSAIALYDFVATKEDELSLVFDEIVYLIGFVDADGWIKVRNKSGLVGLVPFSYLSIKETSVSAGDTMFKESVREHSIREGQRSLKESSKEHSIREGLEDSRRNSGVTLHAEESINEREAPASPIIVPVLTVPSNSLCRVLYEYTKQTDEELTLHVDELIVVVDGSTDGWWLGRIVSSPEPGKEGMSGFFPSNYVHVIPGETNDETHDTDVVTPSNDSTAAKMVETTDTSYYSEAPQENLFDYPGIPAYTESMEREYSPRKEYNAEVTAEKDATYPIPDHPDPSVPSYDPVSYYNAPAYHSTDEISVTELEQRLAALEAKEDSH